MPAWKGADYTRALRRCICFCPVGPTCGSIPRPRRGRAGQEIDPATYQPKTLRSQVQGVVDYGATEAGVVVLALPCVVLFLLLQRHYVRGFMSGALKG